MDAETPTPPRRVDWTRIGMVVLALAAAAVLVAIWLTRTDGSGSRDENADPKPVAGMATPDPTHAEPAIRVRMERRAADGSRPAVTLAKVGGAEFELGSEAPKSLVAALEALHAEHAGWKGEIEKPSDIPLHDFALVFQAFLAAGISEVSIVAPPGPAPGR